MGVSCILLISFEFDPLNGLSINRLVHINWYQSGLNPLMDAHEWNESSDRIISTIEEMIDLLKHESQRWATSFIFFYTATVTRCRITTTNFRSRTYTSTTHFRHHTNNFSNTETSRSHSPFATENCTIHSHKTHNHNSTYSVEERWEFIAGREEHDAGQRYDRET
ncbi:hypothetical protein Hanom_Chr00s007159g01737031 [Helianthus anomalus]